MSLRLVDAEQIKDSIADVRNDKTATNWALLSYVGENSNDLGFLGKGEGGLSEILALLNPSIVAYGLLRVVEQVDNSTTVKFVWIRWIGENIHRMLRARLGTHSGAVKDIFSPYHVNIEAGDFSEISDEIIAKTIAQASGTAVYVLNSSGGSSSSPVTSPPTQFKGSGGASFGKPAAAQGVPKSNETVKFKDEGQLRNAIKDVRSDATPTNWVLLTYEPGTQNTIVIAGAGAGGSEELISHLTPNMVGYGLVRQIEKYDETDRVMFAYVNWVGEDIPRMQKARLGTHSGAVKGLLAPYHADIDATNLSEISPDLITSKVRLTMGTETRVLH